ncbi:MAG TPA: transposase [Planctomycetaceae bacterium]|nr:transposase [Planctomycetaceae bacterium]
MSTTSPLSATAGFSNPDHPPASVRRRYPSDLTDRQWARVESLIPPERTVGRRRRHPLRTVVDALNYRWESGCTWRMLPHDFPAWETVYAYYRRWQLQGVLRPIREAVVRRKERRKSEFGSGK